MMKLTWLYCFCLIHEFLIPAFRVEKDIGITMKELIGSGDTADCYKTVVSNSPPQFPVLATDGWVAKFYETQVSGKTFDLCTKVWVSFSFLISLNPVTFQPWSNQWTPSEYREHSCGWNTWGCYVKWETLAILKPMCSFFFQDFDEAQAMALKWEDFSPRHKGVTKIDEVSRYKLKCIFMSCLLQTRCALHPTDFRYFPLGNFIHPNLQTKFI